MKPNNYCPNCQRYEHELANKETANILLQDIVKMNDDVIQLLKSTVEELTAELLATQQTLAEVYEAAKVES